MDDKTEALAKKIVLEIALMVIQGEANVRETVLKKYGEFGFEIAEEYCQGN